MRYKTKLDLSAGTTKCNCSYCTKAREWGIIVKPDAFTLLSGQDDLVDYQFNSKTMHHLFCRHCGIHAFGKGFLDVIGGDFVKISINCLDDADIAEIVNAPVHYCDGRNNNWQSSPAETRHL